MNIVYPYSGIFFSPKNERNTDSCYNINELQKHYAKWKKPDVKGNVLYGSIYMKYLE